VGCPRFEPSSSVYIIQCRYQLSKAYGETAIITLLNNNFFFPQLRKKMSVKLIYYSLRFKIHVAFCSGSAKRTLGPIQTQAQTPHLANLLATYPLSARGGCTEQAGPVQTYHNVSLHVPAIISLAVTLPTIS